MGQDDVRKDDDAEQTALPVRWQHDDILRKEMKKWIDAAHT